MERKVPFIENEFYHIYNRGVDKRAMFLSESEYQRFRALLLLCNSDQRIHVTNYLAVGKSLADLLNIKDKKVTPIVAIGAYCIMPNHFHILITPLVEGGVTKFMLKLQTAYSMFFNKKHQRSGSLLQGPFKSSHTDNDEYLRYLYAYIHLNPAKLKDPHWRDSILVQDHAHKLFDFVNTYPYSSMGEYLQGQFVICNPTPFPEHFTELMGKGSMRDEIAEWLTLDPSA